MILSSNRLIPMELLEKVKTAKTWGANEETLEKLEYQANTFMYKEALLTLKLIKKELDSKQ